MFSNKPAGEQQQKEQITKHLRTADEYFRFGRYEEATVQLDLALRLDPKNVLARSFKERVKMMQKRVHGDLNEKSTGMNEQEKNTLIASLLSAAEERINAKDYKSALNKISEVYKIDAQNPYARAYSDRIEELQQQQKIEAEKFFRSTQNPVQSPSQASAKPEPAVKMVHGAFFMYRELMKEVWFDGKVTNDEEQELKNVRNIFGITNKEHFDIELEVKHNAYLEALRMAWRDGVLTTNERQVLELMRQRYGITSDEHAALENKVQDAKKGTPTKATILLVDVDREHRNAVTGFLGERNYEVISVGSIEEAFEKIVNHFPHLVLTEIIFAPNQMDGFALFDKLRKHPTLKHIPFFFMSRIRDEKVIRAAMRLGLDLFFPKPVDQELLLAA
ncbi:MAG: response regulator, partial [Bacteroidota bacterium]